MSRAIDFDLFVHPPLAAEQRERLRADGGSGTAERELTFDQFLDAINPLHHIPVVGTLYRQLTGDTIDSSASMVGSVIYGGPLGMVAGLVNAVVSESSGSTLGEHALAMVTGEAPATTLAERPSGQDAGDAQPEAAAGERLAATSSSVAPDGETPDGEAGSAPPAPVIGQTAAAPSPAQSPRPQPSGQLLEGDDALAALAADLRAAVAEGGAPLPAAEGRAEAEAGVRELESSAAGVTAGSVIPPPESFMPLTRSAFSGPRLASDIKAEHAQRRTVPQPALFPASLSAATARARDDGESDDDARRAEARPVSGGAGSIGASVARDDAAGGIAPALMADPRFAAQASPRSAFTERMTEALNKYQALDGTLN